MMIATQISGVDGNGQWLDGGAMFGNVPRPMWQKWTAADDRNRIKLACRALLIEHEGQKILCETGIGSFFEPKLAERFGVNEREHVLLSSLKSLGLTDADIDVVILSHLHFDHAGGLLPSYDEMQKGHGGLLFPKAKYIVGVEAMERAEHPHLRDRASFIPGLTQKLRASGRLVLVDQGRVPGLLEDRLSFRFSSGHTPGQMHTVFRGDQQTVIFCGDLIPGAAWVHAPITMGYDRYPEQLIDEKLELYQTATPEHWLLFFTHDPEVTAAEVAQGEGGKYGPKASEAVLKRRAI